MTDTTLALDPAAGAPAADPAPAPAAAAAPAADPAGSSQTPPAAAAAPAPAAGDAAAPAPAADPAAAAADAAKADWPADWRNKLAGDDKKLLTQLERFTSPVDLAKKMREQDATITKLSTSKGGLAKDASPEQVAAYRKDNGIPETADKYDLTLPDGLVVGESDKPIVDNMLGVMHAANLPNDVVKNIMTAYYQQEKQVIADRAADIAKNQKTQDDELHKEWGGEYRQNLTVIENLAATWSQETRSALSGAIDSDGYPLLNNRQFLKDMAMMARAINPVDTVVSTGGGNQMSSVEDEIKGIEKMMVDDRDGYFKDQKAQKRYLELLTWRENQKPRA